MVVLTILTWLGVVLGFYYSSTHRIWTAKDWEEERTNLIPIFRKVYSNETVELDGKRFTECTFDNVTFVYRGQGLFEIGGSNLNNTRLIKVVAGPQGAAAALMNGILASTCRAHEENCDVRPVPDVAVVNEDLQDVEPSKNR